MPHADPQVAKEWRRGWWARLSQERKAQKASVANARATAIRRWLDAYKLSVGCLDCGYRAHPAALHFDHVRGEKHINVCNAKSLAQAQTEIAKCDVRCANCHAVRTFKYHPCKPDIFEATYEVVPSSALPWIETARADGETVKP